MRTGPFAPRRDEGGCVEGQRAEAAVERFERLAVLTAGLPPRPDVLIPAVLKLLADSLDVGLCYVSRVVDTTLHVAYVYDRDGLDLAPGTAMPLDQTFCAWLPRAERASMVVEDTDANPDLARSAPTGLDARSYTGVALVAADGSRYGTLCTLNRAPRSARVGEIALLDFAGRLVMGAVESAERLENPAGGQPLEAAYEAMGCAVLVCDATGTVVVGANEPAYRLLGRQSTPLLGMNSGGAGTTSHDGWRSASSSTTRSRRTRSGRRASIIEVSMIEACSTSHPGNPPGNKSSNSASAKAGNGSSSNRILS